MKRILVALALLALGLAAVACGGGSDSGNGGNGGDGGNGGNGGNGAGGSSITVTITDTGLTVDNATVFEGAVTVRVVNNSTQARDVYFVPWDKPVSELPVDADGQVDVFNPPPKGVAIYVSGNIENVAPGGERTKNAVAHQAGKAIIFSNGPGDFAAGLYKEITVTKK